MLRLPDPEDVADADGVGAAAAHAVDAVVSPGAADAAGAAVVTDLSERRARNPLFRDQPSTRRPTPDDDDRRSARRARRVVTGGATGPAQSARHDARGDDDPGESRRSGTRRDDVREPTSHDDVPVCAACPFGAAMLALDEVQPDARDHLLAASRELLAAARTVIESLEHTIERQQRHPTSSTHRDVQHVRVRRA